MLSGPREAGEKQTQERLNGNQTQRRTPMGPAEAEEPIQPRSLGSWVKLSSYHRTTDKVAKEEGGGAEHLMPHS